MVETHLMDSKARAIKKVLLITLILNFLVCAVKLIVGETYGFLSVTSSGLDSLFDGTANILALFVTKIAYRPADADHNYGHTKYENLGSLILALLLVFSSFQVGSDVLKHFGKSNRHSEFHIIPILAILLSMAVSGFVTWYEHHKAQVLHSPLLKADAQHTRGDFLMSGGVLVAILASYYKIYWVDHFVGAAICFYLFFMAIKIIRQNVPHLVDSSPEIKENLFKMVVQKLPEVKGIRHFRARGNSETLYVDFHLLLDGNFSLSKAHFLGHRAEDLIRERLMDFAQQIDITVHIGPYDENPRDES